MLSGSNQNIGFEPIFGFEVILNTPSDLDCTRFKLFSTVAAWLCLDMCDRFPLLLKLAYL